MQSFFNLIGQQISGTQEKPKKEVPLPWQVEDKSMRKILKENILDLSLDEQNFLQNAPEEFKFDLDDDSNQSLVQQLMFNDQKLEKMFGKLVPKKISEENFWRNYFYALEECKKNTSSRFTGKKTKTKEATQSKDKELLAELEALELPGEKSGAKKKKTTTTSEGTDVKQLKQELEIALKRISELEERVKQLEQKSL